MIKAIVFDFDGVIAMSEPSRFKVFKKIFTDKGFKLKDEEFKKMIGRTTKSFLSNLNISGLSDDLKEIIREKFNKEYKENLFKYATPIEIVTSFIKNYKGPLRFALASGSDRKVLKELTKHFGILDKFEKITGKEDVTNYKPHPETYFKTIEALGLEKSECIVIEDTVVGIQASINAGIHCYVFINGINNKQEFKGIPIVGFLESAEDFNKLV